MELEKEKKWEQTKRRGRKWKRKKGQKKGDRSRSFFLFSPGGQG